MKRAKGILASLRLADSSFLLTRSLHSKVTRISPLLIPSSTTTTCLLQNEGCDKYDFLDITHHHKFYFSSTPTSIVELVRTKEWSQELKLELEKSHSTTKLTHEAVVYVLKQFDKYPLKALDFFNWVCAKNGCKPSLPVYSLMRRILACKETIEEFKPSLPVYNLMLRILGCKETMKEFWGLVKRMSDEGCYIDDDTYSMLWHNLNKDELTSDANTLTQFYTKMAQESILDASVKGVVDLVLGSDWNDDVKKKLGELDVKLSENVLLRILTALRKHPLKDLCTFRWVEEHMGYKHNAVTYNSMLRVLGKKESIEEFWSLAKELKSAGHDIDSDTYIKLSRFFIRILMLKDAVELYELMMDGPYKPPFSNCCSLLVEISLTDTPDLDLAFRVFNKYEASGQTLVRFLYDMIHKSLTTVGRFDEAEKFLDTMRNAGHEPDNISYSHIVFGLAKAGRMEEACKILGEMEARGYVLEFKTWEIIIQRHCLAGEIDQAINAFTQMLEKNFEADSGLLEVLVNGLCSKQRVDDAYALVIEMEKEGRQSEAQGLLEKCPPHIRGDSGILKLVASPNRKTCAASPKRKTCAKKSSYIENVSAVKGTERKNLNEEVVEVVSLEDIMGLDNKLNTLELNIFHLKGKTPKPILQPPNNHIVKLGFIAKL
ncbi:hypothetical protein IFM89_034580 [Coptis chinensis]|uniref:Pentatricopeptide repeat-containing protein n=1 Tax=Coptis chinensis TaxID=261450 RepID=A0A835LSI5_9MAGN|nr:hypothetical protein IFM89_034580 [Coptis chinensis]